jgi:hypothetical protein
VFARSRRDPKSNIVAGARGAESLSTVLPRERASVFTERLWLLFGVNKAVPLVTFISGEF